MELYTVNTMLSRSFEMADTLYLNTVMIVFDHAIYANLQEIRWKMNCFTKGFPDAGLMNILIESGVVAEGSIHRVMKGKLYNRIVRAHKLRCEALHRMLACKYGSLISSSTWISDSNSVFVC